LLLAQGCAGAALTSRRAGKREPCNKSSRASTVARALRHADSGPGEG